MRWQWGRRCWATGRRRLACELHDERCELPVRRGRCMGGRTGGRRTRRRRRLSTPSEEVRRSEAEQAKAEWMRVEPARAVAALAAERALPCAAVRLWAAATACEGGSFP